MCFFFSIHETEFCIRYKGNVSQTCVFIQSKAATWDEAREICENWGGRLPETENHEEAETISLIVMKRSDSMWLGATLVRNGMYIKYVFMYAY